jgi:NhaP-type Na+/H+ or K+/H+ antiporter
VSASRIHFNTLGYTSLCVTILLVLLGRAISIYPLSLVFRFSRWRIALALLWHFWLRGLCEEHLTVRAS